MKGAATLSERETQVAEKIAEGKTKKQIAVELDLSVRTVENHTRKAFRKVGCRKSTELAIWYISNSSCTINSPQQDNQSNNPK